MRLVRHVGIATAAALLGAAAPAGASPLAAVRVDQVGYPTTAVKRAYLLSSLPAMGAPYDVRDAAGDVVLTGVVGPASGHWSPSYPHVYPLDLSALTAPGSYSVDVGGGAPASSVPFPVAGGEAIYAQPLANAVAFYQAEQDGPDFVPSPLRTAPAHLHDRHAMTYVPPRVDENGNFQGDLQPLGTRIDAAGGWWDAGDYLKFVETTSYTVDMLLLGVRDAPQELGPGGAGDLSGEARFGLDWLGRMWDDRTRTLYFQVGIGEGNDQIVGDHDIWRLPQDDDAYGGSDPSFRYIRNRPVFRAGPPGAPISPNLAGRDAAAFALCYQDFRASEPQLARRCLRRGEHVLDLADTSPGRLLTVLPYDFYPEVEWHDDLELGAAELALALQAAPPPAGLPHRDPGYYLERGARWARGYVDGPNDATDTLNLYDVSGVAHVELARAIAAAGDPAGLAVTPADLLADDARALDRAVAQAGTDPFEFGFPWATWDTTAHGAGLAVQASLYDELSGSARYASWSSAWLANVLGANAWGLSLVVGDGSLFPHCLQHQVANIVGSLDGSGPVLRGAAVEGPNGIVARGRVAGMRPCPAGGVNPYSAYNGSGAVFRDDMRSYPNTEPAIDLTAATPLAFALQAEGRF